MRFDIIQVKIEQRNGGFGYLAPIQMNLNNKSPFLSVICISANSIINQACLHSVFLNCFVI